MDNDGNLDILCGEYGPKLHILYGNGEGGFSKRDTLKDSEGDTAFGMSRFTGASLVDMNNDGLKDLFVTEACGEPIGNQSGPGGMKYYLNTGSIGSPEFTFQEYVSDIKGNKIEHLYLRAQFADMDNDGLIDIVTGESDFNGVPSELRYYRNVGSIDEPQFDSGVVLTHIDGSGITADNAIHFGIADIDNDGINDILLNARHHNIKNYSNWQYEAKLGFLRGFLPETKKNIISTKDELINKVIIKNEIVFCNEIKSFAIYNMMGQKKYEYIGSALKNGFSLSDINLIPGIYILSINKQKIKYQILRK